MIENGKPLTLVVLNSKGGVGKTTATMMLAAAPPMGRRRLWSIGTVMPDNHILAAIVALPDEVLLLACAATTAASMPSRIGIWSRWARSS